MANESFLQRWSRLKAAPAAPAHALATAGAARAEAEIESETEAEPDGETKAAPAAPLPTLADAAMLDADSDYSAFVARGVDADVRRLAMKKLFADPHFNRIDGLDIYMGDYNLASPVSPAMLASLSHARSVFARIDELLDPAAAAEAASTISAAAPATDTTGTTGTTDMTDMADMADMTGAPEVPPPDREAA